MSESDMTTSQSHTEEEDDEDDNDNENSRRASTDGGGGGGGDSSSSSSSGSSSGDDDDDDDDDEGEEDDEDEYDVEVDVGGVEGEVEVVAGGSASLDFAQGDDDDEEEETDDDDDEDKLNFSIPSSGAAKEYQLIVERCEALHQDNERLARRITDVKGLVRKADRMRKFLMKRLDSHKDNYRNVPIVMPPEEDDASIRIAQRRKRRGDYDGVDDRGPRKRGRKPKKKEGPAKPVGRPRKQREEREAGKPKRPQNPFFQFCQDQRKKVAAEHLQERNEELSKKELTKVLAERWRALPTEERKIYNILFEQEKIRYTEEMEKFRSEKQISLLKQMQEQDMMSLQDQEHLPQNSQQHFPPTIHFPE